MKRNEKYSIAVTRPPFWTAVCMEDTSRIKKKEAEIERIKNYVQYFWASHLKEHFREEEEILFPYANDEMD